MKKEIKWERCPKGSEFPTWAVIKTNDGRISFGKIADEDCWCIEVEKLLELPNDTPEEKKPIQRKPTDDEIREKRGWEHSRLSDYSVRIFKGNQLFETEPNFLGDYKHVNYYDKSVKDKIDKDKYYKCWYTYSDASDPADSSEYYYFVYIEEVPDEIVDAINAQEKVSKYVREK